MSVITNRIGTMEYLTAEGITAPHCFTTRSGGVSEGHLSSLNLGIHRGDDPARVEENYRRLGQVIGFNTAAVVAARQIHSDIVLPVTRAHCGGCLAEGGSPVCDGLITATPGVALLVFTADCTPILLHDPVTGAVGAVHAGWRGTAAGIAEKAVLAMVHTYGCDPENIRAAIGPHIGGCCFETHVDVPDAMVHALGDAANPFIRPVGEKYLVDLTGMNRLFLERAGVTRIEASAICTACNTELFWSHRRVGDRRGSQGAVIVCKGGAT